jgi:hypothetical protein
MLSRSMHAACAGGPPAGELKEYVAEEMNVRALTPCADPLRYATLRAEPEWGVLGKRLGKAIGGVAKAVKDLSLEVGAARPRNLPSTAAVGLCVVLCCR